ncbi:MAG: T9SS type A sorting domain-containing protein [Paludibacter sp.]|nr:T9SS type A sorting domain-containing protein [Paludibacter sp.]
MKNIFLLLIVLAGWCTTHAQNKIAGYEYWFNNNYASKTLTTVAPIQQLNLNLNVPTTGLSSGLHTINFRSIDNNGMWSSTLSQFFYKVPQTTTTQPKITAYEYWLNNDYTNVVAANTPIQEVVSINELLNVQTLSNGLHTLNIRFKDNGGMWSSTLSQFFYKVPEHPSMGQNKIVAYRYWFNNDFNQAVVVTLPTPALLLNIASNIDLTQIPVGEHTIHFQFKDALGMWSIVTSDTIERTTITVSIVETSFSNSIVAYPNPTKGRVFVDFGETLNEIKVSIHSINGKLVQQSVYNNSQTIEFNLSQPAGIYLMNILSENKRATIRLIKH